MHTGDSSRSCVAVHPGGRSRRRVRRAGLPLAVLALIINAVVSFAHHHFDADDPHGVEGLIILAGRLQHAAQRHHEDRHSPGSPSGEFCPICIAIHAAATPALERPQTVTPVAIACAPIPPLVVAPLALAERVAAFEPRGPPRT